MHADKLLQIENLVTSFTVEGQNLRAVDNISLSVRKQRVLGIVGESGCGKSVTSLSIMQLIPAENGRIESGKINFDGIDLIALDAEQMRKIRGNQIAMIFQEPMTALNPVFTVGEQIAEVFRTHRQMTTDAAWQAAIQMLEKVSIPDAARRAGEYPHQMSGGMKQRVMIAMALACNPKLLIADEPTTALDVTVQAQILDLMRELQKETQAAIIFITHDLGVIAEIADDVIVMYAGKVVEQANVFDLFENPRHPYTMGLMRAIPSIDVGKDQELFTIAGIVPNLLELPSGCRYRTRCPFVQDICHQQEPPLKNVGNDHAAACHFADKELKL